MFRVNILICKQLYKRCMHFGHNMNDNKGIWCFSISEFRSATNVNEIIEISLVYCNYQNFVHKLRVLPSYGYRAVYILISLAGLIYAFYSQKYEMKKKNRCSKAKVIYVHILLLLHRNFYNCLLWNEVTKLVEIA